MRWRTSKNTAHERGASAVEFALTLIPLLMVIAGIVNFGLVFAQQLVPRQRRARRRARGCRATPATTRPPIATDQWNSTAIAKTQTSGSA